MMPSFPTPMASAAFGFIPALLLALCASSYLTLAVHAFVPAVPSNSIGVVQQEGANASQLTMKWYNSGENMVPVFYQLMGTDPNGFTEVRSEFSSCFLCG